MLKAVIYTRVSTGKQVDGASLDTQEERCNEWAFRHRIQVVRTFVEEGVSAKTLARPRLQELLQYLGENAKKIDYLIVYQMDRLSRDALNFFELVQLLKRYNVILKDTQSTLEEGPHDRLIKGMGALMANYDNDVKSERVKDNMKRHANDGYRMARAPYGLKNTRDLLNHPTVEPIPEIADKIAIILNEFAKGAMMPRDAIEMAHKIGLTKSNGKPMSDQTIARILRQPLYAGLEQNAHTGGEYVRSAFIGIVTSDVYFRIQEILDKRKNAQATGYVVEHPDFPLRRFVRCAACHSLLRGSSPKGRNKHYSYYHCEVCKKTSVANDVLHEQFLELIADLQLDEITQKLLKTMIVRVWNDEVKTAMKRRKHVQDEVSKYEQMKTSAVDKMVQDELKFDEKVRLDARANAKITELRKDLVALDSQIGTDQEAIDYALAFMGNAPRLWNDATVEMKVKYQQMIFPEGIEYDFKARKFGTAKMSALYRLAAIKKEPSKTDDSLLVTLPGIEPGLPG